MRAAAAVAGALCAKGKTAGLFLTAAECNSIGLGMMAGRNEGARSVDAAIAEVRSGRADTVIILENDLYRRADAARCNECDLGRTDAVCVKCRHGDNYRSNVFHAVFGKP